MAQGGVSKFVHSNDQVRNSDGHGPPETRATLDEHARRRQVGSQLRVPLPRSGPMAARGNLFGARANSGPPISSRRDGLQSGAFVADWAQPHTVFDDTDIEAADETTSSFTDNASRHFRPRKAESMMDESVYGADEDDDYDAINAMSDVNGAGPDMFHDMAMRHSLGGLANDDGGDTQPTQAPFMAEEFSNVMGFHGHIMSSTIGHRLKSKVDPPHQHHQSTPRHRLRHIGEQESATELPLRSSSAPTESEIDQQFESTKGEKSLNGRHRSSKEVPKLLIRDSQARDISPESHRPHQFVTGTIPEPPPLHVAQPQVPGIAKASESTLDHTSGYTSDSSASRNMSWKRHRGPELDYDIPTLANLPFATLQAQSFDTDPRAEGYQFPLEDHDEATSDIPSKMTKVSTFSPADRMHFFSSLPLAEWEDCGDWLLDQFQSLLSRAKAARQERRKVAAEFESEIQARYEQVEAKQRGFERALTEMRGGAVEVLKGRSSPVKPK